MQDHDRPLVWVNVGVEREVGERFREDARAHGRSMRSHVRQLIREHVRRLDAEAVNGESPASRPDSRDYPGVEAAGHVVPQE